MTTPPPDDLSWLTSKLPIPPDSEVDIALTAMIRHEMGEGPQPSMETLEAIDWENPAHMLALGTRLVLRRAGVRDPLTLTQQLFYQYYGLDPRFR